MSDIKFDDDNIGSSSEDESSMYSDFLDEIKNDNGIIVTYSCTNLVENNPYTRSPIHIDFYYDLIYPSTTDAEVAREEFESLLLQRIAMQYDVESGKACLSPPEDSFFHMIQISSLPDDIPNDELMSCLLLHADTEENQLCTSYAGKFTGYILGPDESIDIIGFMAQIINDGTVTSDTSLEAKFLGTQIESSNSQQLQDPINTNIVSSANVQQSNNISPRRKVTFIGGMMAAALALSVMGLFFLVYRAKQKRRNRVRDHVIMDTMESRGGGEEEDPSISISGSSGSNSSGWKRRWNQRQREQQRTLDDIDELQNDNNNNRSIVSPPSATSTTRRQQQDNKYISDNNSNNLDKIFCRPNLNDIGSSSGEDNIGLEVMPAPSNTTTKNVYDAAGAPIDLLEVMPSASNNSGGGGRFDLGNSMKSLLSIHGMTSGNNNAYRSSFHHNHHLNPWGNIQDDDDEESDLDSWAQTDGTLGSLDGRIHTDIVGVDVGEI